AKEQGIPLSAVEAFDSVTGRGAVGVVDGRMLAIGNEALLADYAVDPAPLRPAAERLAGEGKTPMYLAVDGRLAGILAVADPIRETSRAAIRRLHGMGLRVVMLTGDNRRTAEA